MIIDAMYYKQTERQIEIIGKKIQNYIKIINYCFCNKICLCIIGAEYGYNEKSANGPQHWGDLKEEWAACKTGQIQSPIDLSSNRVQVIPKLGGLKYWTYKPQHATVVNRGHDVSVCTNQPDLKCSHLTDLLN